MTIFGGSSAYPTLFDNDVWVLANATGTGATPTWIELNPTGGPPTPRAVHGAAIDVASSRMTVFGGNTTNGWLNDSWVLSSLDAVPEALLSISPATGLAGQTVNVTLTGLLTNFQQGMTQANFGAGITVISISVNSSTVATATLKIDPAAVAGLRRVTLTTGTHTVSLDTGFTVLATGTPVLLSVVPNSGQQGQQSLSVTLIGQNTHFAQGTTTAGFGAGITVASLLVYSPTSATVVLSIAAPATLGPRTVSLTTGSEIVSLPNGFTVLAPTVPSITTVSPNSGKQGQAGPVSLVGLNTHFVQGTTQVDFGAGITVSNIVVTCPTCLTAQLQIDPTAFLGLRTITVTTSAEVATLPNGFTVLPGTPMLTALAPASGKQGQTIFVAVTSIYTHFTQATTQVSFGAGITVSNVNVSGPTSLTAQLVIDGSATPGPRTPVVTTGTEVISVANIFSVLPGMPALIGVNPGTGQQGLPYSVALTGQFTHWVQDTTVVSFGPGVAVNSLNVNNATFATALLNIDPMATLGQRTVTMTTGSEIVTGAFTITPGPSILSVNPHTAQAGQQNLSILVTGQSTRFVQGTTQASFGAGVTVSSLTVNSVLSATAIVNIDPGASVGLRDVVFTTGTEVAKLVGGFAVNPATGISLVSPNSGKQAQQNLAIAISGQSTHFVQGTTHADFGSGITVASLTVSSPTTALATLNISPTATLGPRNVTMTTGTEVVPLTGGFTVVAGDPVLMQVSPNTGQQRQIHLPVVITGQFTNFAQGITQVTFGAAGTGVTVESVSVTSSTQLTALISIAYNALLGARPVTVTTGPEIVSLANAFTVQIATNQPPVIGIMPTWSDVLPNRLLITYTVADDGLPGGGALTVSWSVVSTPPGAQVGFQNPTLVCTVCPPGPVNTNGSISVGFDQPGQYILQITATDTQLTVSQNVTVNVTRTQITPPTVSIASPVDGAEVTSAVSVVGSVTSPSLSNWILEYQPPNDPAFHTLATGTTTVANGALGTFDPSLLVNGITYIRLTATDTGGQTTSTVPISLILTRNQKIGNFTVSFNDLSVPLVGLPIEIVRTYDSRRRSIPGDFSYGWTLDLNAGRLAETVPLGDQWTETTTGGAFPTYRIQSTKAHVVTVTLPDGTAFQFAPTLNPSQRALLPIQLEQVAVTFSPTGTTPPNVALAIAGNNQPWAVGAVPGPITLTEDDLLTTFDPDLYNLTLPDGRTLLLSRQSGLKMMSDLNGNTLKVTDAGVLHSSGKNVAFTRDPATHLITAITDPAGKSIGYAYNPITGDLKSVTDRTQQTTTFTYLSGHALETIKDPRGIQPIKNEYDTDGRLISHTDAFGNVILYTHNLNTRQEIVTDRLKNVTVNEYDTDGNIVKVTDAKGGVTQRMYDGNDNLKQETNALGKVRTYTYDSNNNRSSEKDPLNHITTYTYNARNQLVTIMDALNRLITTNVYDDLTGNLKSTTTPDGQTTYLYWPNGLRKSMTDPTNATTQYEYDSFGNLSKLTGANNQVTLYTYDQNNNTKTETRMRTTPSGSEALVTLYDYDDQNRLIKTTYPDHTTTQIQYNAIGKQSITTDQLYRQTIYEYDLMGRLTKTTYPDQTFESSMYDAEGHRVQSTDRAQRSTGYQYDELGRLFETDYADNSFTKTSYDAIGEVIAVQDGNGNVTQYAYDDAGRRIKVIDALKHVTVFDYDELGNQKSMTDANNHTTQYQYDISNRRVKVIYPDSTTDQTNYDADGRTVSKTDQANLTTQYTYDKLGRLIQVTDVLNQTTSYLYDEVGNRIQQTDAKGHATKFEYDQLGRRIKRTLPLGMSEKMTYDAVGNLKTKVDFNGRATTYSYDPQNNRLTAKMPDPGLSEPMVSFQYTNSGQRSMMVDASGTTTYIYDMRDRLMKKVTPAGTLTYNYDLGGNLKSIRSSNAGGTSVDYMYDQLNRLSTVQDNRLASGTTTYAYDMAGNLQSYLYPNGVQSTYKYDALNRLTNLAVNKIATALASYGYTLGMAGNRTQVIELGGRQVNWTYDNLYRLMSETITGSGSPTANGAIGYQYDRVGNRIQRTSTIAAVPAASYSYDDNDRLSSDTYDFNGNTIGSGGNTYAYDFENHLKSQNGGAVTIVYDGDGNRVAKTAGGVTTQYLVDDRNLTGYAQVLEELVGGAVQRVYTYGLNRISQSQASGTSFYGYDGHGNVRILTDTTGAVTDRYDYDAFGNVISQAGSTPNVYLYSGEQNDPNLDLYYLRARYMSQSTGRFWTMDSDDLEQDQEQPISLHKYLYADADPANVIDPLGHQGIEDIGLALLAVDLIDIFSTIEEPRGGSVIASVKAIINPPCQVNLDKFTSTLTSNTNGATMSGGNCSHAVYVALQAGGANFGGRLWPNGKAFGSLLTLPGVGFTALSPAPVPNYSPKKGDVAVIQPVPGAKKQFGHVEAWNGSLWVSDFLQMNGFWPGPGYRKAQPAYAIYRCQ